MAEVLVADAGATLPDWLNRAIDQVPRQRRQAEPLEVSAPLALDWSEHHCGRCRAYHGLWQYRRMTGGVSALAADGAIYQAIVARLAEEEGLRRILIAASADYAQQAVVRDAFRGIGAAESDPEILVVDRCATPLHLNAWLAERRGGSIETRQGDLLNLDLGRGHELIVSHSLFFWFAAEDRIRLLRRWYDALAPGGRVLLSNRIRYDAPEPVPDERSSTAALVGEIEAARDRLPAEVVPRLLALAPELYGIWNQHRLYGLNSLLTPFTAAGFELEGMLVADGALGPARDPSSVPGQGSSAKRHLVVARRPR